MRAGRHLAKNRPLSDSLHLLAGEFIVYINAYATPNVIRERVVLCIRIS